jgi:hypothetical protein
MNTKSLFSNQDVYKLAVAGSTVIVGAAVKSLLNTSWKTVAKKNPPLNPAAVDTSWKEAILWTIVSSAAIGLAQLLARRGADALFHKANRHVGVNRNATLAGL